MPTKRTLKQHAEATQATAGATQSTQDPDMSSSQDTQDMSSQDQEALKPKPLARRRGLAAAPVPSVAEIVDARRTELPVATDTMMVLVDLIDAPEPDESSREDWTREDIERMADSLERYGMVQPLVVTNHPDDNGRYKCVIGGLRLAGWWEAKRRAEERGDADARWETIHCVVRHGMTPEEALEHSFIANTHIKGLNPLEIGSSLNRMVAGRREAWGQGVVAQLADRIGWHPTRVYQFIKLLALPKPVQDLIRAGQLTEKDTRVMGMLSGPVAEEFAKAIAERRADGEALAEGEVRQAAHLVQRGRPLRAAIEEARAAGSKVVDPGLQTPLANPLADTVDAEFRATPPVTVDAEGAAERAASLAGVLAEASAAASDAEDRLNQADGQTPPGAQVLAPVSQRQRHVPAELPIALGDLPMASGPDVEQLRVAHAVRQEIDRITAVIPQTPDARAELLALTTDALAVLGRFRTTLEHAVARDGNASAGRRVVADTTAVGAHATA